MHLFCRAALRHLGPGLCPLRSLLRGIQSAEDMRDIYRRVGGDRCFRLWLARAMGIRTRRLDRIGRLWQDRRWRIKIGEACTEHGRAIRMTGLARR